MKHIQRLRKMVTLAFQLEWIDRDPFVKFKPHLIQKERGFLTADVPVGTKPIAPDGRNGKEMFKAKKGIR